MNNSGIQDLQARLFEDSFQACVWLGLTDHDECLQETDDCEQICLNHVGHYSCNCEVGCNLLPDGTSCQGLKPWNFTKREEHTI